MPSNRGTSNGPDVTDIAQAMEAISSFHSVELTILLSRAGARGDGDLKVTVLAERRGDRPLMSLNKVSRSAWYPHRDVKTLEGALFKLLYELDRDCGQMWAQSELFVQ